jgi:hypothetical protein
MYKHTLLLYIKRERRSVKRFVFYSSFEREEREREATIKMELEHLSRERKSERSFSFFRGRTAKKFHRESEREEFFFQHTPPK